MGKDRSVDSLAGVSKMTVIRACNGAKADCS